MIPSNPRCRACGGFTKWADVGVYKCKAKKCRAYTRLCKSCGDVENTAHDNKLAINQCSAAFSGSEGR